MSEEVVAEAVEVVKVIVPKVVKAETLIGIYAIHFFAVIADIKAGEISVKLAVLAALAENFLTYLERVFKADRLDDEMLSVTIKATEKYGFPFDLNKLKELKSICLDAAEFQTISPYDLEELKNFLSCLLQYSYFISPYTPKSA